jgi:hypothetical protein
VKIVRFVPHISLETKGVTKMQASQKEANVVTRDEAVPAPPSGYDSPIRFQYPGLLLTILNIVFIVLTVPVVGLLVMWIHGAPNSFVITFRLVDFITFWGTMLVTVLIHELIHAQAALALGYRINFGIKWRLAAPYVAALHQFITRDHNLLIAVAPLFVLTAIFIPLLFIPVPLVLLIASTVLVINTAGSVGDLYLTWRFLRLPRQTLLYDVSPDYMLIFPPKTSDGEGRTPTSREGGKK